MVDGIVYTSENISTATNTTKLGLGDTDESWHPTVNHISAPQSCIYRLNPEFISTSYYQQDQAVFNADCIMDYSGLTCEEVGSFFRFGMDIWKITMYNGGQSSFSFVDDWFFSHSTAMTAHYRNMFGSAIYNTNPTAPEVLPAGGVVGEVLETTVCIAVDWRWLSLPGLLLIFTLLSLIWAIIDSWRSRYTHPVWKDSLLPLIFYKDRFKPSSGNLSQRLPFSGAPDMSENRELLSDHGMLLEADEMEKLARRRINFCVPFVSSGRYDGR